MSLKPKHARNLVVMLAAGGEMSTIKEMAKLHGIRAIHVQQLALPVEEINLGKRLIEALKQK